MTTAEKIRAMRDYLATIDPAELDDKAREIATGVQMMRGFGWDPFDLMLPEDPTDLEQFIDDAIRLLLGLRGDDLPPFDVTAYGEVPA